jgi:hypothetical protein
MSIANGFRKINWQLHRFLLLLGLRRRQQYFGTVYDSVSKQPLDPAMVKLVSVVTGEVVETCITDMFGRYSFLTAPGRYKILVNKSNYGFPSQQITAGQDGIFSNLYHGEFFDLVGDSDVITFNIPMDPVQADWNQQAKKQVIRFSPFLEHFLDTLVVIVFWFVLLLALLDIFHSPGYWVLGVLGFYGAVFLAAYFIPKPRLWGRAYCGKTGEVLSEGTLELSHAAIPGMLLAKCKIFEDGKFFLRVAAGEYLLKITGKVADGQQALERTLNVRIGPESVIYRDVAV